MPELPEVETIKKALAPFLGLVEAPTPAGQIEHGVARDALLDGVVGCGASAAGRAANGMSGNRAARNSIAQCHRATGRFVRDSKVVIR